MQKPNTKSTARNRSDHDSASRRPFSLREIREYLDPGPAKEAEEFVQLIYDERRKDAEGTVAE